MKPGSKYYPLFAHLKGRDRGPLTLTLADIETLLQQPLPASARTQRAWWSNRSQGALQAAAWLQAGYRTQRVNLATGTITFVPYQAEYRVVHFDDTTVWDQATIKSLRKTLKLTQAEFADTLGVRRQTVSEWENGVYSPDRSTLKHLQLIARTAPETRSAD
ncbi:MAG: helix-turn-helix transcriptional regulator [Cyanobacteria bacterium]|nr:helix-turn-helix transcriptional regulator [Cyanobacteriota bacterium]